MLEDFIITNKLDSEIIKFPSLSSTDSLIASKKLPSNLTVKVQIFDSKNDSPFITIIPYHSELDIPVLKSIVNVGDFLELDTFESVDITGYKKGFIPTISVFGVKIIIDSSLENKAVLFCRVGEKSFLKTSMTSILDTNNDIVFEKII